MTNTNPLNNRKYDVLDSVVEYVYNECVKIDCDERKCLVNRFQKVLELLIKEMKKDPGFNQVFCRIGYTGSFYDGLRVNEATEYDLNLILKPKVQLFLDKKGCLPGFIGIHVPNADCQKPVKNWIQNNHLNPKKVTSWLKGVTTKTLRDFNHIIEDCKVSMSESGPAVTLKVKPSSYPSKEISIDLVPVIEFSSSMWPPVPRKSKKLLGRTYEEPWFAVPKGDLNWRMSFPIQEKHIINQRDFYKYTLKLLKKVRDEFDIGRVASYHIKTLFLWELENQEAEMWSKARRGRLFMHMLVRFRDALSERRIPFYWDVNCNMIGNVNESYLVNNFGKLKRFIQQIDKHLDNKEELEKYIRKELLKGPRNKNAPENLLIGRQEEVAQWNSCAIS